MLAARKSALLEKCIKIAHDARYVHRSVRFAYEWRDNGSNWHRSYGNENWEFAENGLMQRRIASINDVPSTPTTASCIGLKARDRLTTQG